MNVILCYLAVEQMLSFRVSSFLGAVGGLVVYSSIIKRSDVSPKEMAVKGLESNER